MAHVYRNITPSHLLKEAGGLVEEIAHHIQYVEGMGKYVGNGGAVDRHLDEIRTRLDRLYYTHRGLSKFIKDIDSLLIDTLTSEEMTKEED